MKCLGIFVLVSWCFIVPGLLFYGLWRHHSKLSGEGQPGATHEECCSPMRNRTDQPHEVPWLQAFSSFYMPIETCYWCFKFALLFGRLLLGMLAALPNDVTHSGGALMRSSDNKIEAICDFDLGVTFLLL